MRKLGIISILLLLLFSAFKSERIIRIYMIGDSTMANKPLDGNNQERGWGQALGGFFSENVIIENHAVNGRSSKSFIDEGRWKKVIDKVSPGDYVFIQFGHNDEKLDSARHTEPGGTFDDNLRMFVRETRLKGGIPVLFNSIVRRYFGLESENIKVETLDSKNQSVVFKGDTLVDTHGKYLESPRNVANEMGVCFIDMNGMTKRVVNGLGVEKSKELYVWAPKGAVAAYPQGRQDNTHLNVNGARTFASLAVKAIEKQLPELGRYIRYYDYVVAKDGSGDFFSLQDAIDASPNYSDGKETKILVRNGVYKEYIVIPECKNNISIVGEKGVIIENDNSMYNPNSSCSIGKSVMYVYAKDCSMENLVIKNQVPESDSPVFIGKNHVVFKDCRIQEHDGTVKSVSTDGSYTNVHKQN